MKIKIAWVSIICFFLSINFSYAQGRRVLQIKGSDTMVNLVQAWAEEFMKKNPSASIAVTGGGSGVGIASLINKTCDIAESSRKMKLKEIELAKSKGVEPKEFIVGYDGLAVVVHPSNPVDKLTFSQLSDIFTGKIKNWKELGGRGAKIVLLSREVNSGTHIFFKEQVLRRGDEKSKAEFAPAALLIPSSQAIADEIAQNPQAIGYYGIGYVSEKQKAVAVARDDESPYVKPTLETVMDKSYAIWRPLFFYTDGQPTGLIKEFIDFVLSDDGQKIVKELDFVPLRIIE